jgi:hypothetical protein
MSGLTESEYDTIVDHLTSECHGSGFDGEWSVQKMKNGKYRAEIGYHCMDENGYYDGWLTVNAYYDSIGALERITFTASKYHRRRYLWDCYIAESVPNTIPVLESALETTKNYIPEHS